MKRYTWPVMANLSPWLLSEANYQKLTQHNNGLYQAIQHCVNNWTVTAHWLKPNSTAYAQQSGASIFMGRISYLLDSNILSEPAPQRTKWHRITTFCHPWWWLCNRRHRLAWTGLWLWITTRLERKKQLQSYLAMLLANGLIILPFDQAAAEWYAKNALDVSGKGKTCAYADGEIAAIA